MATSAIIYGKKDARAAMLALPHPAYMYQRLDLGVDVWQVGTVEHNYEAKV